MNWTPELRAFVAQHLNDDTDRLLLSSHRYPDVDVREAVEQICARRQIRYKLPEWYALEDLVLGGRVPAEQCSSEQTARYKRNLVVGESLCDLTGGMGVDFYYMSQGLKQAIYTERQPHLVEAIEHNLQVLYAHQDAPAFTFRLGDGRELPLSDVDTLYLDPARRANDGSRVYDIADCEPNVVVWQEDLLRHCRKLIVKLSPMVDISSALQQLSAVTDVHIVAVKNECKEVLVEMQGKLGVPSLENLTAERVAIHCIDYRTSDVVKYDFQYGDEPQAVASILQGGSVKYLYEPDVTLMKAAPFKRVCQDFPVQKLDVNSHFYASEVLLPGFPGRAFEVEEVLPFSSKLLKSLKRDIPQANVSARNFPLTADQLRSRAGIRDGGSIYLVATTIRDLGAVLLRCHKALLTLLLVCLFLFPTSDVWARKKRNKMQEVPLTAALAGIVDQSPYLWNQGKEFVFMNEQMSPLLLPEEGGASADSVGLKGGIWTFDAIVSEEDWMGQQKMMLRFLAPSGKAYRFNTERVMSQRIDTTYHPAIGVLQPLEIFEKVDSVLRARTLYILINDERILGNNDRPIEKFVPVTIDSITVGTELAPIHVWFTEKEAHVSFLSSLPDSRENRTSTPLDRYLSFSDPYLQHPDITKHNWQLIQKSQVEIGMTLEEVRLSIGRPLRFERYTSKSGLVERWYYPNSRILEFWDGHFRRIGREKR